MSNEYYNAPESPVDFTKARAAAVRDQFSAIEAAFDKLPTPDEILNGTKGPKGDKGDKGDPGGPIGPQGLSAYQVAVEEGFVGTEAQWLASLVGPQGPQGIQGPQGPRGIQGPQGVKGDTGAGSDWGTLANRPANLLALATAAMGAGTVPLFDGAGAAAGKTVAELFSALDSTAKQSVLNSLNVARIVSMQIAATGYIEFALPGDNGNIMIEWGQGNYVRGFTTVPYPKAGNEWSICVMGSSGPNTDDQTNSPNIRSTAKDSFVVGNSRSINPGWWIAVVR